MMEIIFEGNNILNKDVKLNDLRQKWEWYFKTLIFFHIKQ